MLSVQRQRVDFLSCLLWSSVLQRLQEQEHTVHDSVELHLRVPLEKEVPITVAQQAEKKGRELTNSEDEFPEITEVNDILQVLELASIVLRKTALNESQM